MATDLPRRPRRRDADARATSRRAWAVTPAEDLSKTGKLVRERLGTFLMSDTKWRKVIAAVRAAHPEIETVSVKFVDGDSPRAIAFPPPLDCPRGFMDPQELGPTPFRAVEWMQFPVDVSDTLATFGWFAVEVIAGETRILGYSS